MPLSLKKLNLPSAVYWFAALAVALRIAARLLYTGIANFWVDGYSFLFELAQNIAAGKGISMGGAPTGFRAPLYPIFLAGLTLGHQFFWPIVIAQSLIGAATAIYAALLACRMFPGQAAAKAATLAAAITALYPYYVIHDTAMQETSLFTLLTLVAVLVLDRTARTGKPATGALAGLVLGLDVLTRTTIAPLAVLAPFWLLWRRRGRAAAACALLIAVAVVPWIVRNAIVMGVPTLSTETGIQLWGGNNGFLFTHYPKESSDLSKLQAQSAFSPQEWQELVRLGGDEALTSRWYRDKALEYIRLHPWQTVVDGFRKNAAAFYWLPSPRHGMIIDFINVFSYGPVMLLGLWGMARRRALWRDDSLIYLLFATFMLVTAIFWAHTSHRVYLDVYWIVFGAGALAQTALSAHKPSSSATILTCKSNNRPLQSDGRVKIVAVKPI